VYGVKVGLQILNFTFVLKRELLQKLIELTLGSADFFLKQFGTFLQVATDVTHWSFPLYSTLVESPSVPSWAGKSKSGCTASIEIIAGVSDAPGVPRASVHNWEKIRLFVDG
jgi:hypothetical protein